MFLEFQAVETETERYEIIRDTYVSNGNVQGIFFLVAESKGSVIKQMFVDKEDISDEYKPKKVTDGDVKLKAYGVEYGSDIETESVLIVEKGVWIKKGALNKEIEIPAKRYRFIITKK